MPMFGLSARRVRWAVGHAAATTPGSTSAASGGGAEGASGWAHANNARATVVKRRFS